MRIRIINDDGNFCDCCSIKVDKQCFRSRAVSLWCRWIFFSLASPHNKCAICAWWDTPSRGSKMLCYCDPNNWVTIFHVIVFMGPTHFFCMGLYGRERERETCSSRVWICIKSSGKKQFFHWPETCCMGSSVVIKSRIWEQYVPEPSLFLYGIVDFQKKIFFFL